MTKNNKMLQLLLTALLIFSLVAAPMQSVAHAMTVDEELVEVENEEIDLEEEAGEIEATIELDDLSEEDDELDYVDPEGNLDEEIIEKDDQEVEYDETDQEWPDVKFDYFEVTNVTSTTITVEWKPSHNVIEEYSLHIYGEEEIILDGNATSYTFTDLVPERYYNININGFYTIEVQDDDYSYAESIYDYVGVETSWTEDELIPVNFIVMLNDDMTYNERILIRGLSESNQMLERDMWIYSSDLNDIKLPLGEYEIILYNSDDHSISAQQTFTISAGRDYLNNPLQFKFQLKEMTEAAEPFKYEIINVKENSFTLKWNDVSKINGFRVYYERLNGDYWDSVEVEFKNEGNEYVFQDLIANQKYWIDLNVDYKYDLNKYYYFNVKTDGEDAKADKVKFTEEALRDAAAKEIGIYDRDITVVDMEDLYFLNLDWKEITDLEGIQFAKELKTLYLEGNDLIDISLLKGLTNLTRLDLRYNNLTNTKALADLINLEHLDLYLNEINDIIGLSKLINLYDLRLDHNTIEDISALSKMVNLEKLGLSSNLVENISILSGLVNLTDLDISYNEIVDISSLESLTKLNDLRLNDNQIVDVSKLENLTNLEYLYLDENKIEDITSLANLSSLTRLDLSYNQISDITSLTKLENLETLYLTLNNITELPSLSELINLTSLSLSWNDIENIEGLSGLTNLESLFLNDNEITDISVIAGLKNLRYLDLAYNEITDISVLRELPHLEEVNLYGNKITDEDTIQYLLNEGVYVDYDYDDWNDWEDEDEWDDEEIIIDFEELEKVFRKESGFAVSGDGKTITFDISNTGAGETVDLTPEQIEVLTRNNQNLDINRGGVKASIPASSFDNYDEPVTINVNEIKSDPNSLSSTYDFTIKQGTRNISQFDEGITLTFNVNVSRAKNPNNLKVFYKNEETGEWENIGGSYHNGAVTVVTHHFSTFTVFEAEEENSDTIVELEDIETPKETDKDGSNDGDTGQSGSGGESSNGDDTGTGEGSKTESEEDQTPDVEEKKDTTSDQKEASESDKQLPSTATSIYNDLMIGLALMLIGLTVLFVSKRRKA